MKKLKKPKKNKYDKLEYELKEFFQNAKKITNKLHLLGLMKNKKVRHILLDLKHGYIDDIAQLTFNVKINKISD